jgi:DNA-binding protein H-NS
MAKITNAQIQALTLKEAVKLRASLDTHIGELQEAQKAEVLEKVNKMLDEVGLTTSDLKPPKKARRKSSGKPIPPKYELEGTTWTGRGRKPKVFQKFVDEGGNLEELEIK